MNVFITWPDAQHKTEKKTRTIPKMQFRQRKTHKSSSAMARSQPENHQVGSPLGFETKLRFWPRNGNYETDGSSKTTKTKQPRMFPWSRLRKSRDDTPRTNFADTQGLVLPKSASSASSSTTEESQISSPPRNTKTRDTNSPRTFQVTCPVGLERGNRLDIRSPSGILPLFAARVPTGKLGGDTFVVQAPTEEALVQADDGDLVMAGALCGIRPCACSSSSSSSGTKGKKSSPSVAATTATSSSSSWQNLSYTLDDWLTPTPQVVGRPVEKQD